MIGLEKIVARIERDGQETCRQITQSAARKASAVRREYASAARHLEHREHQQLQQHLLQEEKSRADLMRLERRAAVLKVKQEMIARVFAQAAEGFAQLDSGRKTKFYLALMHGAALADRSGEILLRKADRKTVGGALLDAYPTHRLSEQECGDAGFVLRYDTMEIDCTVKTLLEEVRRKRSGEVAHILFGGADDEG